MHATVYGMPVWFLVLFFGILFYLLVIAPVIRRKKIARMLKDLGFAPRPRDEAIAHADVLARMLRDRSSCSLSNVVATGRTEWGETALFWVAGGAGDDRTWIPAVAFRMPEGVPDFKIESALLLDRLFPGGHDADIGAPGALRRYDRRTHQWTHAAPDGLDIPLMKRVALPDHPEFSKHYYVWSADDAAMRRMLTAAAMAALVSGKGRDDPCILKRLGWLVVYGMSAGSSSPSARRYPQHLQRALELVRHMDWKAASHPPQLST